MRRCTSLAPASRSMATMARVVVPRTIESSTTTRRLPRDRFPQRVQFAPHTEGALAGVGVDKSAPDVTVFYQAVAEGHAAAPAVPLGRGHPGIGHPDDHVGATGACSASSSPMRTRAACSSWP